MNDLCLPKAKVDQPGLPGKLPVGEDVSGFLAGIRAPCLDEGAYT